MVVVASVWVSYAQYWAAIGDFDGVPTDRIATVREERIDESFNTISASPLVFNLRHLDDAKPFGLRWFRDGPTPLGIVAGVVAVAAGRDRDCRRNDRGSARGTESCPADRARAGVGLDRRMSTGHVSKCAG